MILSDKPAHLLVTLLESSLSKDVVGYLNISFEDRACLLNEIINQQDNTLLDRTSDVSCIVS